MDSSTTREGTDSKLKFLQNFVACDAERAIWGSRKGACWGAGKRAEGLAGIGLAAGDLVELVALKRRLAGQVDA